MIVKRNKLLVKEIDRCGEHVSEMDNLRYVGVLWKIMVRDFREMY